MKTICIRKRLESESPHLPELRPLIGKEVEITVIEKTPAIDLGPGHGNWDAVAQAARELIVNGGYDFEVLQKQDEIDRQHASDHLP